MTDTAAERAEYGMRAEAVDVMSKFRDVAGELQKRIDDLGSQLRQAASRPEEVTVEFGVELESSAGLPVIAQGRATCHLVVTATWRAKD
ncbi:CU044_2847 family protein [Microbispora sp. NPDC049125]|uniref:CU044_2847 family protein n=1 Tax=Microbispora sp. NPDC049125 TaxID=3154929 RepID=UPI00346704A8